ncbi:MAG: HEAT repeat domain-containing protein [Planktothrix sp.]
MDDFLNIEPTSQSQNLSASINIESGRDLVGSFNNAKNPGEKVELFFAVAENKPEVAFSAFAEILKTQGKSSMRALALQGLSRIRDPQVKQALAACDTEEDLEVLRYVANEVKGEVKVSSDLTRWAAAWAIEHIGFPSYAIEHLQGGALTDPPRRIRNEIINRKLQEIDRIQQLCGRNEITPEYEKNLEFWVYGPTEELFRENSASSQYKTLVGNVIYCLNVRGIELAIGVKGVEKEKRRWLQEQALQIAGSKFAKFTEFEQKRAYETIEYFKFLDNSFNNDIPLRKFAAQAIKQAGPWLSPSVRARSFVICEQWQQVAAIGEPALSDLQQVIEKQLILANRANEFDEHKIKALETILAIFDNNHTKINARTHGIVNSLLLTEFLINNYNKNISWRKSAAQVIKQAGSWLQISIRARSFVICEEWQQVVPIGELALSHLEEVIENQLILATNESEIINQQIKAVETISKIQFTDFSEKIRKLAKVLLRPEEPVRKAAARLLDPHKAVAPKIASLVEALLFEYRLDKPELKDSTVSQMNERLSSCRKDESLIATTFSSAIAQANSLAKIYSQSASTVQQFLQSNHDAYFLDIREWIGQIEEQIAATSTERKKVKYNQKILNNALSSISGIDSKIYEKLTALPEQTALNSPEYKTYNQCQKLSNQLEKLKRELLLETNGSQSKLNQEIKVTVEAGLWQMGLGLAMGLPMALVFVPYFESYESGSYSRSSSVPTITNTINTPWYATGFPKLNGCGSSSSSNNCWHPVFIQYSDYNWSRVLSNHCGDIGSAQSQITAKERGKIQIASFNNVEDAQGFATYMSSQYGSGWVGKTKCY